VEYKPAGQTVALGQKQLDFIKVPGTFATRVPTITRFVVAGFYDCRQSGPGNISRHDPALEQTGSPF
jgi:hypothetical protein